MLTNSRPWTLVVTVLAAVGFVGLLGATLRDSRFGALEIDHLFRLAPPDTETALTPGTTVPFIATAYCKGSQTRTGLAPLAGMLAADSAVLPLGSVVELDFSDDTGDGLYSVVDTGPEIQGREVDLYMWSCIEATAFGRRPVRLTVLRRGWDPRATRRGLFDGLFRRSTTPADSASPRPAPDAPTDAPASR